MRCSTNLAIWPRSLASRCPVKPVSFLELQYSSFLSASKRMAVETGPKYLGVVQCIGLKCCPPRPDVLKFHTNRTCTRSTDSNLLSYRSRVLSSRIRTRSDPSRICFCLAIYPVVRVAAVRAGQIENGYQGKRGSQMARTASRVVTWGIWDVFI